MSDDGDGDLDEVYDEYGYDDVWLFYEEILHDVQYDAFGFIPPLLPVYSTI